MSGEQAKRTIYDSVFTDLFSDPENRVRLYRELHPEEDIRAEDIQVTTLKAVLTDHLYNDLGMQVGNRMLFLAEAQSTWCENIAFRAMVYLAETLKKITVENEDDVYREKAVPLPKPELYVIYTGKAHHEETELSLAGVHWNGDDAFLDVKVKVLYGEQGAGIIYEYAAFCHMYRRMRESYPDDSRRAVTETIEECIRRGILRDYLERRRNEVMTIMEMLFDQKTVQEMHERNIIKEARAEGRIEGIAEGRIEGIAEGRIKGIAEGRIEGIAEGERSTILALVRDGDLSLEKGAAKLHMDPDAFQALLNAEPDRLRESQ